MISSEEKTFFVAGYKNISDGINIILSMIAVFKENKEIIYRIIGSRFNVENSYFPFEEFMDLEPNLINLKEYFVSHPVFDDKYVTEQYKAFMKAEVVSFIPENLRLLQSFIVNSVEKYIKDAGNQDFVVAEDENRVINNIYNIPRQYISHYKNIEDIRAKLHIFYQIRNIDGSIVMIGANGSGKSSLARQLNNKISSNIVILSAQRFLYYQKKNSISTDGKEIDRVRAFQRVSKSALDQNIQQLITTDMNQLMEALLSQHIDCATDYYERDNKQESVLSRTIAIWNQIIEHRKLCGNRTGIYVTGEGIAEYDFNLLSEGEKAIFYYIGHVLIAEDKSYIVVDEPENHLNLTICNRLWDILEKECSDCKFIYLTHNLSFATSRSNCTILWNKKFTPPYNWDFEILPQNSTIPPMMVMEIVGSRKAIMFCEGHDKGSMDYMLYSILFPKYTVIPVAGHRNVISYVNAYNSSTSGLPNHAVGIIDGDHHLPKQIEKWKKQEIYTIPVNEIENIICDNFILEKAAETFCSPVGALEKYYEQFWKVFEETKEQQATNYIAEYINNSFNENFLHETKKIDALINEAHSLLETVAIKKQYTEVLEKIKDIISRRDYSEALRFVNFKKGLTKGIAKVIVDGYENRILDLIKKDDSVKDYIRNTYFPDCPF